MPKGIIIKGALRLLKFSPYHPAREPYVLRR